MSHQNALLVMPVDSEERKLTPMFSGLLKYFPDACILVARCSQAGNDQHHPGEPLHWDKSKSFDHTDAMIRHALEGEWEKVAWRALAQCQTEIESGWRPHWYSKFEGK